MTWWIALLIGIAVLAVGYGIGLWYADMMMRKGQSSFHDEGNKGKIKGSIYFPTPPTNKPDRRVPPPEPLSGAQYDPEAPVPPPYPLEEDT